MRLAALLGTAGLALALIVASASAAGPLRVVEAAGAMPEVAELVQQHKQAFTHRLTRLAAEAGAPDPETLARRLALLFDGARALSTSLNDTQPFRDAHDLAKMLIDQAVTPAPNGPQPSGVTARSGAAPTSHRLAQGDR